MKKILIASDHGGYDLKTYITNQYAKENPNLEFEDLGPDSSQSVDYPDFADKLCHKMKESSHYEFGILICGSGQGMSIRANKFSHIRAALCWSEEIARLSRAHNNANVLCMGGRFISEQEAKRILDVFLNTDFEGGRHTNRVEKLAKSIC